MPEMTAVDKGILMRPRPIRRQHDNKGWPRRFLKRLVLPKLARLQSHSHAEWCGPFAKTFDYEGFISCCKACFKSAVITRQTHSVLSLLVGALTTDSNARKCPVLHLVQSIHLSPSNHVRCVSLEIVTPLILCACLRLGSCECGTPSRSRV